MKLDWDTRFGPYCLTAIAGIVTVFLVDNLSFEHKTYTEEQVYRQKKAWADGHNGWGRCIANRNGNGEADQMICTVPKPGTLAYERMQEGVRINEDGTWFIPKPRDDQECLDSRSPDGKPTCVLLPPEVTGKLERRTVVDVLSKHE